MALRGELVIFWGGVKGHQEKERGTALRYESSSTTYTLSLFFARLPRAGLVFVFL